jgi:FkbM family methyltransferase
MQTAIGDAPDQVLGDGVRLRSALARLLDRDVTAVRTWEAGEFARLAGPRADHVVLFGAGNLGRKTATGLARAGTPAIAFADNNQAQWGKTVCGLPVLSPAEAAEKYGHDGVFVVTIWSAGATSRFADTRRQLEALGCACVLPIGPLFWRHAADLLPHYALDLPHQIVAERDAILAAAAIWADERSRAEYEAQIRWRLEHDFDVLPARAAETEYFPEDLVTLTSGAHFIDCGAYDGDTARRFFEKLDAAQPGADGRVTAFEPDPANFDRLAQFVDGLPEARRDGISLHKLGVSDERATLQFYSDGTAGSSLADLTQQDRRSVDIHTAKLDEILAGGPPPTLLKLDVEGAEAQALRGAERTIREHLPILAVCVYHRQADVWRLPLQIRAISDRYRFYLRSHSEGGFDVVCYAIPV